MIARILKFGGILAAFVILGAASAYLTLSFFIKSEKSIVVPNLVGKNVVAALEMLSDLSLNTKIKGSEYSDMVPKHHVLYQVPRPGSEIKPGREVRLIVSKGKLTVVVPKLDGLSLQQARFILEENGLRVGRFTRTHHPRTRSNTVLAQYPMAGNVINQGERVNLLTSLGERPPAFLMPELIALSLEAAILEIEDAGLRLGAIKSTWHPQHPANRIIAQDPPVGYRIMADRPVDLIINRKPGTETLKAQKQGTVALFRYRIPFGFLNRHIQIRLNSYGLSLDLQNAFFKPGREIWCFIPQTPDTSMLLYQDDELVETKFFE